VTALVTVAFFKNMNGKIVYGSGLAKVLFQNLCQIQKLFLRYFGPNYVSLVVWVASVDFNEHCIR